MPTKIETAASDGNEKVVVEDVAVERPSEAAVAAARAAPAATAATAAPAPTKTAPPNWAAYARTANVQEVKDRLAGEIGDILKAHGLDKYCCLALIEPQESIDSFDLDQIFRALNELNPDGQKDVILFILSRGGEGEPAYQISKLCKSFAHEKFIVVVPRHAKSAATLIAIGADEIHMGPLGQLGPIDPQIGGLPALGVSQALKTIASVSELYPKSAEMFARYLRMALTVEQIGYCDRISESAVQYAERLLSTKPQLAKRAPAIAKELVHEYKDHNFVIDFAEAQLHLGSEWIKTETPELQAGEEIYSLVEMVNFFLRMAQSKRFFISGGASLAYSIMMLDAKR
jgi:membrane-bound ClpP family serine protease